MSLANFFSASEARTDRWRQLNAAGRAWEAAVAQGKPDNKLHAEAAQLFAEISPLEELLGLPRVPPDGHGRRGDRAAQCRACSPGSSRRSPMRC